MEKVGIVSTVRAPIEEIKTFIQHHRKMGIEKVVLFFDDPNDDTYSKLENDSFLTCIACDEEYWLTQSSNGRPDSIESRQKINANVGAEVLKESGCQWLTSIDADELIFSFKRLNDILSQSQSQALRFNVVEAVPEKINYDSIFEPTLFRTNPSPKRIRLAQTLGCKKSFLNNEYYRGHTVSKMAVRITDSIQSYGIHDSESINGKVVASICNDIYLLHFDCIGLNDWQNKWNRRLDGSGKALEMRENRSKQMQQYSQAREIGSEALKKLYKSMYFIPYYEKFILSQLNMLKRIVK